MTSPLDQYHFDLPESLIAQYPLEQRDKSRLLLVRRASQNISHHGFADLPRLLPENSLLVFNNTKVLPRRLRGRLPGGGRVEILLVEELEGGDWSAKVKKARRIKPGMIVSFSGDQLKAEAIERTGEGHWILRFPAGQEMGKKLEQVGLAPLPPYIRRNNDDPERDHLDRAAYQTCFAKISGAIAAPTAGLHFTPTVLNSIREGGVETVELTLHVGLGTFNPIKTEDPELHVMHRERFEISAPVARAILNAKTQGRPVISVGTTTVRALESWANVGFPPGFQGWSDLFIRPPYTFQVVDGLITNFHQPRSTLLMMVSAFHGREKLLEAYREAIALQYRFFSFGDCMAILPARNPKGLT